MKLISSGLNNVGSYLSVHKGSFLIWALLIVAMEKAAQRMDSYMKSIIGNVAITGGGILDDLVATTSAVKGAMSSLKGGFGGLSGSKGGGGGSPVGPSGSTGGTLGAAVASIGRKFSAASAAADVVGSGGVAQATMGGALFGAGAAIAHAVNGGRFQSSLKNGGKFASSVIGRVAHGNGAKDYGFIQDTAKSATASNSMSHYFGGGSYSNATIGNGEASAQTTGGNVNFYAADSHQVPDAGTYESVTAKDGSQWYKQISKAGSSAPKAPRRL